ncbi:MAG: bifunctional diaminohydroxyphosphoribosylaminopyrimidine deaminase/5-amino-6-(5-phosphoribosylamino)uracil reductase RibD [Desulfobacterales bacterium]|jgi:diaminohydroxyphosphoribosylaminopyrimidine deaminase/5-amino-6-(5-phosphoribosylamino)uracil reductase|nr:bifunctional diaminohydroxyphosphoribosylaminopyrimidine deaminase/5-amino-6-(5-phosphoribosylamino)uracil reductase RibD [Desulfobacterales bacterium]
MDDIFYMKMALDLAAKGIGYTAPNPMVGAVVVKEGKVVGKGWHQYPGGPHAEVYALDDAGPHAKGADIYVTLEPCNHHGKTPPCTDKIIGSGIRRVVMAMEDPNPDVAGGGAQRLEQAGIEVVSGVCEIQARRLIEFFTKYVTTKRPFVILKLAATLDGRIAARSGDSKWVTSEASRRYVHELRHAADAIMVGANTIKTDDPQLTTRLEGKEGKNPKRIILDTNLSIPEDSKVLHNDSPSDTIIITGSSAPSGKRKQIEKTGVQIFEAKTIDHLIDLNDLMAQLGQMRITSLLIEGGSRVAASALKAGIVDKICFFYAPKILGGDDGVPMLRGPGPELMKQSIAVKDITVQWFDDDVMIEGYVIHSSGSA